MSTGDRDVDVQQEILTVLSDMAGSLRTLRRLAVVAMWIAVALFVAFAGMTTVRFHTPSGVLTHGRGEPGQPFDALARRPVIGTGHTRSRSVLRGVCAPE